MSLNEYINIDELMDMIANGYISRNYHPKFPLVIYNYTKTCQAEGVWNDTTCKCRGLIVNTDTNEIIARPYQKFFNYEELVNSGRESEIPDLPYTISEKVDGSLGIMYWYDDVPYIATKGSFESEQAVHATEHLHTDYLRVWDKFNRDYTYLFEIVYPEDHHCISYGQIDDIILTGVINTETGDELTPRDEAKNIMDYDHGVYMNYALDYSSLDWKNIRDIISDKNREGFVVKFSNNFRIKLKYESYWKIHYARTGLTEKKVFKVMEQGVDAVYDYVSSMEQILDEENMMTLKSIIHKFYSLYSDICCTVMKEYLEFPLNPLKETDDDRKELTIDAVNYYKAGKYPHLEMAYAKGKNIEPLIWNYIKKNYKIEDRNNEEDE